MEHTNRSRTEERINCSFGISDGAILEINWGRSGLNTCSKPKTFEYIFDDS